MNSETIATKNLPEFHPKPKAEGTPEDATEYKEEQSKIPKLRRSGTVVLGETPRPPVMEKLRKDKDIGSVLRSMFPPDEAESADEAVRDEPVSPAEEPPPEELPVAPGWDKLHIALAIGAVVLAALSGYLAWKAGYSSGGRAVESKRAAAIEQQAAAATPETLAQLDAALGLLREEKAGRALDLFDRVRIASPELPALDYLAALAALRDGNLDRAEILAKSSAQKREREADSLVLLGVIEAQRGASDGTPRLIDPNRASLEFIQRAMKADPSSPAPRIEAANAFRSLGKNGEALAELDAARLRMLPVDLLLTVDVTRALLGVEVHGTEGPHLLPPRAGDWPSLFQGALVAMKNNDFSTALMYLEQCREGLPPMTFFYLVSDPSLRKFAFHPEARSFFQQFE